MPPFEFATAARIVFGEGTASQLTGIAQAFGKRFLLVTGRRGFPAPGLDARCFTVQQEPTLQTVREGAAAFREAGCDGVIAAGGGSVIDAGKAIAAAAANTGD